VNSPPKPAIVLWIIAVTFISIRRVRDRVSRDWASKTEEADEKIVGDGDISDADDRSDGVRADRQFAIGQARTMAGACWPPSAAGGPGASGERQRHGRHKA